VTTRDRPTFLPVTRRATHTSLLPAHPLPCTLNSRAQAFRDLDVSEATFEQLVRLPETELSLREFVCVQVRVAVRSLLAALEVPSCQAFGWPV